MITLNDLNPDLAQAIETGRRLYPRGYVVQHCTDGSYQPFNYGATVPAGSIHVAVEVIAQKWPLLVHDGSGRPVEVETD